MKKKRDRWPSKTLFIFATVGSAVGLGNLWRFPYLVGKYGGGTFLIPYVIALFLVGFPLLVMEFALGQKMQRGAAGAMKKIDPKLSGIGLGNVLSAFVVACYYAVVMGWCLLYTFHSFTLAWGKDTKSFFFNEVLQVTTNIHQIGGFSLAVFLALLASWIMVYFCVWRGVNSVSKVIQVTMPLPVILLLILLLRTFFLPGAMNGINFYLRPNFSAFFDLDLWMAAVAQVFFTLSLGFGVMVAYASYQKKTSDIVLSALITSIADALIAITAGFVVFSTLGHMSLTSGIPIAELAATGPSLAFVVFPKALSLIPGATILSVIFFIMLITLAIDSLFSLVEAVAVIFQDRFPLVRKRVIVFCVCLANFLMGLVFTTTAGIYYLDITDHFITKFGLVLMGLGQVIAVGWFYGAENMRQYINKVSNFPIHRFWNLAIKYFIPFCLILFLGEALWKNITIPYEDYPTWTLWTFGWGVVASVLLASISYSFIQWRAEKTNE